VVFAAHRRAFAHLPEPGREVAGAHVGNVVGRKEQPPQGTGDANARAAVRLPGRQGLRCALLGDRLIEV
jgi:hypothetical protein